MPQITTKPYDLVLSHIFTEMKQLTNISIIFSPDKRRKKTLTLDMVTYIAIRLVLKHH